MKKKEQYQNTVVLSDAVVGKAESTRILRPLLLVETTSGVKSASKCISFARLYAYIILWFKRRMVQTSTKRINHSFPGLLNAHRRVL